MHRPGEGTAEGTQEYFPRVVALNLKRFQDAFGIDDCAATRDCVPIERCQTKFRLLSKIEAASAVSRAYYRAVGHARYKRFRVDL